MQIKFNPAHAPNSKFTKNVVEYEWID